MVHKAVQNHYNSWPAHIEHTHITIITNPNPKKIPLRGKQLGVYLDKQVMTSFQTSFILKRIYNLYTSLILW